MPEKHLRRRNTAQRRPHGNTRALKTSPSPSPASRRRFTPSTSRKTSDRRNKVLKRSRSEPSLWKSGLDEASEAAVGQDEEEAEVLFRPKTCTDLFVSSDYIDPQPSLWCNKGYEKEAKVVVNVTVEGSPGPIRTLVKLGANVDETIKLVMKKYKEEGRRPKLDTDAASFYELHSSNYSLESLNRSDLIGDAGSRSFYLRKGSDVDLDVAVDSLNTGMLKFKAAIRSLCKLFGCLPCS